MATIAPSYQNELEQWHGQLPPPVQSLTSPLFGLVVDAPDWVAGDPDALVRAGSTYLSAARIATVVKEVDGSSPRSAPP
jgi:hypothetical protein